MVSYDRSTLVSTLGSTLASTLVGVALFRKVHGYITFGNIELYPLISVANLL